MGASQIQQTNADTHVDWDEAMQRAIGAALGEMKHLRQTILAMREEMESLRADRQQAGQEASEALNDEIRHLRSTVGTMREQLENLQIEKQQQIQAVTAQSADEIRHLRETVQVLRNQLEARHAPPEPPPARDEGQRMHDLVFTLKDRLEHCDAGERRAAEWPVA
jgi:chromosome segregation ATPase